MGDVFYSFWSFVGVSFSIGETFLSWNEIFVGKKSKKSLDNGPLMHFLDIMEGNKQNCLRRRRVVHPKVKRFFCVPWSETKMFIKYGPLILIDFLDCVSSH